MRHETSRLEKRSLTLGLLVSRVIAAVPFFVVAGMFGLQVVAFTQSDFKVTPEFRSMARWPALELLASAFGILLPLTVALSAFLKRLDLPGVSRWGVRWVVACALLLPLFLSAWNIVDSLFEDRRFLLVFMAFTVVHWIAFECDQAREQQIVDDERSAEARIGTLQQCAVNSVKIYGGAMLATFLAVIFVFAPMDIFGGFVKSGAREIYMSVSVGVFYFLLIGASELFDLDGLVVRRTRNCIRQAQLDREWVVGRQTIDPSLDDLPAPSRRVVSGLRSLGTRFGKGVPVASLDLERSEEWLRRLPVNSQAKSQIQYWDGDLVRFGEPFRHRKRSRWICLGGFGIALGLSVTCWSVATNPRSFQKKYAPETRSPHRAYSSYGPTEESDRDAFRFAAGFFLLVGSAFGLGWWCQRKNEFGKTVAVIDFRGARFLPSAEERIELRSSELAVREMELSGGIGHASRSHRLMATFVGERPSANRDGSRVRETTLLNGVSLRDAEIVARALQAHGMPRRNDGDPKVAVRTFEVLRVGCLLGSRHRDEGV